MGSGGSQQAVGTARRHRSRQRWLLAAMFSAPLLFMLIATCQLTGQNGLHQRRSDLQFSGNSRVPRHLPFTLQPRSGKAPLIAAAPARGTTAPENSGASGGSAGKAAPGSGRAARRLISNDDATAAELPWQPGGTGLPRLFDAAPSPPPRLWPCQQQQAATTPGEPRVWLYTLLGADYEGTAELLPHWLHHYLRTLGFSCEQLLVVVNHNSSRPEATAELAAVQRVLEEWGLQHLLWTGRYSSDAHLKVKLQLLDQKVKDVNDWIVIADSDEFHSYPGDATVTELLQQAEQQGSTWVAGQMVDRVTATGELSPVQAEPSLFEQFPYNCQVVRQVSKGSTKKVVAAKAFFRTNTGNHWVVSADQAREYFAGAAPGERSARGGWFGAENLWPYTPYSKYTERYQYEDATPIPGLWQLSQYPVTVPVYHFKWHHGVLQSAADRFQYYSGNVSQPGGFPRYKHYNESQNILEALAAGRLDVQGLGCSKEAPVLGERFPLDETQGGLPRLVTNLR